MKELHDIEKRITLARQKIDLINDRHVDFRNVLKEWNVIDAINEFQEVLEKLDEKFKLIKENIESELVKMYFFRRFGKCSMVNGLIGEKMLVFKAGQTMNSFLHTEKSKNTLFKIILGDNEMGVFNDIVEDRNDIENLSAIQTNDNFVENKSVEMSVSIDEDNRIMKENIKLTELPRPGNKKFITEIYNNTKYVQNPDISVLKKKFHCHRTEKTGESENNLLDKCDKKIDADNAKNIRDRIYFISPIEAIDMIKNNNREYLSNETIKRKYENFEKNPSKLSEYVHNPDEHKYQRYSQELKIIENDLSEECLKLRTKMLTILNSSLFKVMKEKYDECGEHLDATIEKCEDLRKRCIENVTCKANKILKTLNNDDSNEIGENKRKYYLDMYEDINSVFVDLRKRLSGIREKYGNIDFREENEINELPTAYVIFVSYSTISNLLRRIDYPGEENSNEMSPVDFEKKIQTELEKKIEMIKSCIIRIEVYFTDRFVEILRKIYFECSSIKYLRELSNL